ncbi:MAG TPA: hypothetical protein VK153_00535 [Candidatus Paceibacterota bacterium]|nr:hypothetical protein [Candidatus Paceibacterota bacterium]
MLYLTLINFFVKSQKTKAMYYEILINHTQVPIPLPQESHKLEIFKLDEEQYGRFDVVREDKETGNDEVIATDVVIHIVKTPHGEPYLINARNNKTICFLSIKPKLIPCEKLVPAS